MGYSDPGKMSRKPDKMNAWKPGDPLAEADLDMLQPVIAAYTRLGFSPRTSDIPTARQLKKRFRIWKNVLIAAGLPIHAGPVQPASDCSPIDDENQHNP